MKLTYVPVFWAEGHDADCGAQQLEPCDCVSGIIRTVRLAFAAQLAEAGRKALEEPQDGR